MWQREGVSLCTRTNIIHHFLREFINAHPLLGDVFSIQFTSVNPSVETKTSIYEARISPPCSVI